MIRLICTAMLLAGGLIFANGVGIIDATTASYLQLKKSSVDVTIESQISITRATQVFENTLAGPTLIKYGFPLGEGSSAIDLRWKIDGQWYSANINEAPQDTTLPGSGGPVDQNLLDYLGATPMYFAIPDIIPAGDSLVVEITYVELLAYSFGKVEYRFPNAYSLLQSGNIDLQELDLTLNSQRTISSILLLSGQPLIHLTNSGTIAEVRARLLESPADSDYLLEYELDLNQLGLFGFSTRVPDSLLPDTHGGFFTFIAEPDPASSQTIDKVFTLIIDRSGSMSGDKIVQARDAAGFIVNNLNVGDRFNVVDFASDVTAFSGGHVDFNTTTRQAALSYISILNASGSTNISGAFTTAIPQFSGAGENTANIIVFFTDGQATVGITNTDALLNHVTQLQNQTSADVQVFTFGIGSSVNTQLLTLLAAQNNGLAEFLGNDELFERITEFYLKIRNPVLLNTQISFSPAIIGEVYPDPLPNLYIGQQMIVSGRYQQAQPVSVTLSGTAFGQPVSYNYNLDLAAGNVPNYQFLTKVWAKSKIEQLLVSYYSLNPNDPQAEILRNEIVALSLSYRVISPFTGLSGGTPVGIEEELLQEAPDLLAADFRLLGNYPNPFNPATTIRLQINSAYVGPLQVRTLTLEVSGPGVYEIRWDGLLESGLTAASGTYVYVVELKNTIQAARMILLK